MPLYQGILKQMSGGSQIAPDGTGYRVTGWGQVHVTGVDTRVRREFIEIGDEHVRSVVLTTYQDELLAASVGEEVALSVVGSRPGAWKRVVAMRTRRGVVKPSFFLLVSALICNAVWLILFGVLVGGIVAGLVSVTGSVLLALMLGGAIFLVCLAYCFITPYRVWRAWRAL